MSSALEYYTTPISGTWTNYANAWDGDTSAFDYATTVTKDANTIGGPPGTRTNFGAIPAGATIDGILVEVYAYGDADDLINVALSYNGTNYTNTKSVTPGTGAGWKTLGGSTDTWGRTWSESEIDTANFKCSISYVNVTKANAMYVGSVRVTVYYVLRTATLTKIAYNVLAKAGSGVASIVYSLRNMVTPAAVSLVYDIDEEAGYTKVAAEFEAVYSINEMVDLVQTYVYNVRGWLPAAHVETVYDIRGLVAADVILNYHLRNLVSAIRGIVYSVLNIISATTNLAYHLRNQVASLTIILYSIRSITGAESAFVYSIRNIATAATNLAYNLRNQLASLTTLLYSIRSLIGAESTLVYAIRNIIDHALTLLYSVGGPVAVALIVKYHVRNVVSDSRTIVYVIRNSAAGSVLLLYGVRSFSIASFRTIYEIRGRLATRVTVAWMLRGEMEPARVVLVYSITQSIVVATGAALVWNVRNAVASARDVVYNVLGNLRTVSALRWEIRNLRIATATLKYNVFAFVASSVRLVYTIGGALLALISIVYNLKNSRHAMASFKYNIRSAVGADSEIVYDIRSFVSATRTVLYNIYSTLGKTTGFIYSIRERAETSVGLIWNVFEGVLASVGYLWDIFSRIAGRVVLRWRLDYSLQNVDPYMRLFDEVRAALEAETVVGGSLDGFRIYSRPNKNQTLYFPCVVLDMERGDSLYMFGGRYNEGGTMTIKLMFTRKSRRVIEVDVM